MIVQVTDDQIQIGQVRDLFIEYATSLGVSLCFQGFDREVADLPGAYGAPLGRLLLVQHNGQAAGCVALRPRETAICEMKRLYVRPTYRGAGLGRQLAEALIAEARKIGYARMRLDTLPSMASAAALYRSLGFAEIPAYYDNPVHGAQFMELDLQ